MLKISEKWLRKKKIPVPIIGEGTLGNPYRIKDVDKLPTHLNIKFFKVTSHFSLENNYDINAINIRKSRNILIKNCDIEVLNIVNVTKIMITDNEIEMMTIINSKGNIVKKNRLSEKGLERIRQKYILDTNKIEDNSSY
jgi:hypothetical protein